MGFDIVSRFLFPTPQRTYDCDSFPGELIWVPRSLNPQTSKPEDCIPCLLFLSPSARFLIFYLHSNAEDLGKCHSFCELLREHFQAHVLAVEYPGYGICPGGQADEHSTIANASAAFRFVRECLNWPLDSILLLGRSVGTGIALALAAEHEVYGVALISPFLSVQEVCRSAIGPLAYFIEERLSNKDCIPLLKSPLLVVHGQKDQMVPHFHGETLYELCTCRKLLISPMEMEHNTNLHADASYLVLPMLQFFRLPDYCFDEMRVPKWAYDRRLSIFHHLSSSSATLAPLVAGPVGPCGGSSGPEDKHAPASGPSTQPSNTRSCFATSMQHRMPVSVQRVEERSPIFQCLSCPSPCRTASRGQDAERHRAAEETLYEERAVKVVQRIFRSDEISSYGSKAEPPTLVIDRLFASMVPPTPLPRNGAQNLAAATPLTSKVFERATRATVTTHV